RVGCGHRRPVRTSSQRPTKRARPHAPYLAARRAAKGCAAHLGVIVESVIPLPRAWLLASALLVGVAVGQIVGIAWTLLVKAPIRPDIAIALVVGVPSAIG